MSTTNQTQISFPTDFLSGLAVPSSLGEVPRIKLFSAEFFVAQLRTLWRIAVPGALPERFVFVSLIDAIIGEIYSARDALRHFLSEEIRKKGLEHWRIEILSPLEAAMSDDNWMARIDRLRNEGLHGNYLPENLRLSLPAPPGGSALTDLRLVGFENAIVQNAILPDDLQAVCDRMRDLIDDSEQAVASSVAKKESRNEDRMISDGLITLFGDS